MSDQNPSGDDEKLSGDSFARILTEFNIQDLRETDRHLAIIWARQREEWNNENDYELLNALLSARSQLAEDIRRYEKELEEWDKN